MLNISLDERSMGKIMLVLDRMRDFFPQRHHHRRGMTLLRPP